MHEPGPFPENRTIHRQHVASIGELIKPGRQFVGFRFVLLLGDFNPGLNLANGDRRKVREVPQ